MKYSSLVILARLLKMISLKRPDQDQGNAAIPEYNKHYIISASCILAANRCDNNLSGKCLYPKNLINSTFLVMTYFNLHSQINGEETWTEELLNKINIDLHEQWNQKYYDYSIKMFNLVN